MEDAIIIDPTLPGQVPKDLLPYATVCSNAVPFLQELKKQLVAEASTCKNGGRHTVTYTMVGELISLLDATVQGDHS